MTGLPLYRVFLGSSEELKEDRERVGKMFNALKSFSGPMMLDPQGDQMWLKLEKWEYDSGIVRVGGTQHSYDEKVRMSQHALFLFQTKYGPWTREEVENALQSRNETGTPHIAVWFRDLENGQKRSDALTELDALLSKDSLITRYAYGSEDELVASIAGYLIGEGVTLPLVRRGDRLHAHDRDGGGYNLIADLTDVPLELQTNLPDPQM